MQEVTKQVPLMSAMLAQSSKSGINMGSSSGPSQFHESQSLQQMPFTTQFSQMPISGPFTFVSQTGSGSYNNFGGNNCKNKGKGKGNKFFSGSQPPQSQFSRGHAYQQQFQSGFQPLGQQMSSPQAYQLF